MAKVNVEPDCGNAPKKLFIRDLLVAVADNDMVFILDCLTDNVQWELVRKRSTAHQSEVEKLLQMMLRRTSAN